MKTLRNYYFILFFIINYNLSIAQNAPKIHSHNDYNQTIPFWNAYSNGANSIEADIFLKNNDLYVAHNEEDIVPTRTLEALYLKPLESALKMKYRKNQELFLLIDIKSDANKTLNKLIDVLAAYSKIINSSNIKIIISGNRPNPNKYATYPNYIYFDHQVIENTLAAKNWTKVAMVSTSFRNYSEWNGLGRLTHKDFDKVSAVLKKAKKLGKPFRFWATPDTKTAWRTFTELKVDIINTDTPYACETYVSNLSKRTAVATVFSEVYIPTYYVDQKSSPIKNVILLIGDGNGLSQISSAVLANNGALSLTQLKSIGFIKTQSADDLTTDSAGAGTAIATGEKTNNRAIGTNVNGEPLQSITELLFDKNYKTGIITTDKMTGATPASFYAHQIDRSHTDAIAKDLLSSKLHFFAGGGANAFMGLPLSDTFKVINNIEALNTIESSRVGVFLSAQGVPSMMEGRGNLLAATTKAGIQYLDRKNKPFFLMVEAAKIDSFGHQNNTKGIVTETIDFDRAITEALKFADADGQTLVVITADHETSGFTVTSGNLESNTIEGGFVTHDHTAVMVPVFAYGPHSQEFQGVYENNELFSKILKVINRK